jgi:hypothetical protein
MPESLVLILALPFIGVCLYVLFGSLFVIFGPLISWLLSIFTLKKCRENNVPDSLVEVPQRNLPEIEKADKDTHEPSKEWKDACHRGRNTFSRDM